MGCIIVEYLYIIFVFGMCLIVISNTRKQTQVSPVPTFCVDHSATGTCGCCVLRGKLS